MGLPSGVKSVCSGVTVNIFWRRQSHYKSFQVDLTNKPAPITVLSYKSYVATDEFGRIGQFVTSFSNHNYTGIPIRVYGLSSFNASHSPKVDNVRVNQSIAQNVVLLSVFRALHILCINNEISQLGIAIPDLVFQSRDSGLALPESRKCRSLSEYRHDPGAIDCNYVSQFGTDSL